MQTFVIGLGRGGVQVYSAPMLHWAAAGEAHLRMKGWRKGGKGGGRTGRRRKKDTVIKCGVKTQRQKKMRGKSAAPVLFSVLLSSITSSIYLLPII